MTVEAVKVEETQIVDNEEAKVVDDLSKKIPEEEVKTATVEKSSSYREESNFPSELSELQKKALSELKAKLDEAVNQNAIFSKEDAKKKEKPVKETVEEAKEGEEKEKKEEVKPEGEETEKKDDEIKPEGEVDDKEVCEKKCDEGAEEPIEEKTEEINKDISLWGVPLLSSKGSESTDVVLLKFLRAREFKVNDAFEMLKKTLQWRKENTIDSVLEEELDLDLSSAFYMNGIDREGRPVCYNIYGEFANEELYRKAFGTEEKRKQFLRWRFQLMEKGIQKLDLTPSGVTSLVQVSDLRNSPAPSKKELRTAMNQAVNCLQDNYPELVAKNIFINVPFWYYALNALLSPFLTQRTKSKFVIARPAKATETLLKYIPAQEIPVQYGGFKRENDFEFGSEDGEVSELVIKADSTATIQIPATEVGPLMLWDVTVLGWEVTYKEEFVPTDEGSYTIIIQKSKKMNSTEAPIRNTFKNSEAGKVVLTIKNNSSKKKRVLYRYKTKKIAC